MKLKKLRKRAENLWLFGGAGLTTSLLNLGLVDELSLAVNPILLGSGKPLFRNITDRIHLTLLDSKSYSSGIISLRYSTQLGKQLARFILEYFRKKIRG